MKKDEKHDQPSTLQIICIILGGLCFLIPGFLVVSDHLGFHKELASNYPASVYKPFFSRTELWIFNSALGIIGGILMDYKNPIISAISGLIASIGILGLSIIYFFWRESIYSFEVVIVMFFGCFPGLIFNAILRDKYVNLKK